MEFDLTSSQLNFYNDGLAADETMWNHIGIIRFNKKYTRQELSDSLDRLLQLQEGLRLQVKPTSHGPVSFIRDFTKREYPFFSFSDEKEMETRLCEIMNRPRSVFEELFDCAIFELPDACGYFANIHHILLDGFSTYIIAENLRDGLLQIELPADSVLTYRECVENENNHRLTKRYARDVAFWKEIFADRPQTALLSAQERTFDFSSAQITCDIPADLLARIRTFCAKSDAAPDSFFLAVYASYFHRRFDTNQFAVGVPVLNRNYGKQMHTVGLFMHSLPLIIDINADISFAAVVQSIEDSRTNLCKHQKFTQHDLRQLLKEDKVSVGSLFDVVADYIEFPKNDDFELQFFFPQTLSVPLEIHVQGFTDDTFQLTLRYRTACFDAEEIRLMADAFLSICAFAVGHPDCAVADLPLYSDLLQERTLEQLRVFNDTAASYPTEKCIHTLFEEQAAKMPEKTAVISAEETLTYEELNRRANRIAHALIEKGVGKGDTVGVMLPRKTHLLSALFGILKTGAAYLPISLDDPQERIRHILTDSKAKMLVDEDAVRLLLTAENTENPHTDVCGQDTCYCIYTSGSTGEPKGACISHGSLLNRIMWMQEKYPLDADGVILQKTPYTFDVSVWELFWWSLFGGQLALSAPDEHFLPAKILEETDKNKVTHLHFVPSVFDLFLTYLEKNPQKCKKFASVKQVFLSGEALSASLVNRFYALFDYREVKLANLYGPTECTIDVTYYDCAPNETDPVPIGKPIANTQIRVVDEKMQTVPVGVTGELCIAGVNVGQGYLHNPVLTAQKFVKDPFGDGKLYKTGDLAFWRSDGNIVFCGRQDGQIKLHGQRIEIGEIESVIASVQDVQSATVVVQTHAHRQILVAFYCAQTECERAIRAHCELHLPQYMVPRVFVRLAQMPLNANGKTDRKQLMQMPVQLADIENGAQDAQNETERMICRLFSEELGVSVGRNDNFFDCGGTSLSMISLLSQPYFSDLTREDFIRNATPMNMAVCLQNRQKPDYSVLQLLQKGENAEKAIVLIPFAGGDAASFAALTYAISKRSADYDIYYVRFLHTEEDIRTAAREMIALSQKRKVFLYSHCAGSAVAVRILRTLEQDDKNAVAHFVAGGSIPPDKPVKRNIWRTVPLFAWKAMLKKAGAPFVALEKEQVGDVYARYLLDTDLYFDTFAMQCNKLHCPVSLLMSKEDVFTKKYDSATMIWERYFSKVHSVRYIAADTHYFQSENSEETAEFLLTVFE
ncbi:MAG: amino acid adenylation domain-containing protein [Clostridia bacterium]|nr:amino acid adenylation domain-containing protein [Clostridia bacterium]